MLHEAAGGAGEDLLNFTGCVQTSKGIFVACDQTHQRESLQLSLALVHPFTGPHQRQGGGRLRAARVTASARAA